MIRNFKISDSPGAENPSPRNSSREDYFIRTVPEEMHGRLGYGGDRPKLVGCQVFDYSTAGAYVEPYAPIQGSPKLFTLEINGQYQRARLVFVEGQRLRLEFLPEDLDYIEAE